jgi:hypothetical protein
MEPCVLKYKETKNYKFLFMRIISGQKWPWIMRVIEITIKTLGTPLRFIKPVRDWIRNTEGGANGRLFWLVKEKKYEEGYVFGLERLNDWLIKMPKPESAFFTPNSISWWMAFSSVCQCAGKINNEDALPTLSELVEKGPGPKEGYPEVEAYYYLSRLVYNRKNYEAAWDWIGRAIKCDDSFGWSYYFRAWLGVFLKKGQPLDDLVNGIKAEPGLREDAFKEELFNQIPNLLDELKAKLLTI